MCDCASSSSCACEGLTVQRGQRGRQGIQGPPPGLNFSVTTLPAGDDATIDVTGGPGDYDVELGIPRGADGNGVAGQPAWSLTTASYTVPVYGAAATITVAYASWMAIGQPVFLEGAGTLRVQGGPTATTAFLINPGDGWATPGASIPAGARISPGGVPGEDGAEGPAGPTGTPGTTGSDGVDAEMLVLTTIPTAAPAPGRSTVIVTDSATTPTYTNLYSWSGTAWNKTGSIQGAAGTQIVFTAGDPNSTLPAGAIGTVAIRTDVLSVYAKTGASTWTLQGLLTPTFTQVATASAGDFGTVAVSTQRVIGFVGTSAVHSAPGTYTFDLAYQKTIVSADKDIALDWTAGTYANNGQWFFEITNTDGSPINITYASTKWSKSTGITEPATLAAGATQLFVCHKVGSRLMIVSTAVVANI